MNWIILIVAGLFEVTFAFCLSKAKTSTGIGAIGTVLVGIVFFKEPISFWRLFFIVTLIGSIVGLKILSK